MRMEADSHVHCFGKLPTYGDYYGAPAASGWNVEFHDWLMTGFVAYRTRLRADGSQSTALPPVGWVIRLAESDMTVLCAVADYGGDSQGRPFPMCFYVGVPSPSWPGPTSGMLPAALGVLDRLADVHREVGRCLEADGQIDSLLVDRALDLSVLQTKASDDAWIDGARAIGFDDWFAGAAAVMRLKEVSAWCRATSLWGDTIAGSESESFEVTLRFPLSTRGSKAAQAAGWLRWLESRMNLKRRSLSLVVSSDVAREAGHFGVIARPIVADDFLMATPLCEALPYVDDAARVAAPADADPMSCDGQDGVPICWVDFVESGVGRP